MRRPAKGVVNASAAGFAIVSGLDFAVGGEISEAIGTVAPDLVAAFFPAIGAGLLAGGAVGAFNFAVWLNRVLALQPLRDLTTLQRLIKRACKGRQFTHAEFGLFRALVVKYAEKGWITEVDVFNPTPKNLMQVSHARGLFLVRGFFGALRFKRKMQDFI